MKRRNMSHSESRTVYRRGADRIHRHNLVGHVRGTFRL